MALVVSGERSDGFRVIDEEGFVYLRDCKKKGTTYLKCSNDVCRARGTIRDGTTQVSLSRGRRHCHAPSREEEELTRYRHDLRERAKDVSDVKRFRQIFDATSERLGASHLVCCALPLSLVYCSLGVICSMLFNDIVACLQVSEGVFEAWVSARSAIDETEPSNLTPTCAYRSP